MCFKANHSVSPIEHRSSETHVSIKNCLSWKPHNGRESRTRFNFPNNPDRVPQIVAGARDRCFHVCDVLQTYRWLFHRPIADHCRSYGNQALQSVVELNLGQPETNPNQSFKQNWNPGKPHAGPHIHFLLTTEIMAIFFLGTHDASGLLWAII